MMAKKEWVHSFEKPQTDPTALLSPATTCLSPYLKFGCLSAAQFYAELQKTYEETKRATKRSPTQPPVSLEGQLLWREFFYTHGDGTPGFETMEENPICMQVPWNEGEEADEFLRVCLYVN